MISLDIVATAWCALRAFESGGDHYEEATRLPEWTVLDDLRRAAFIIAMNCVAEEDVDNAVVALEKAEVSFTGDAIGIIDEIFRAIA